MNGMCVQAGTVEESYSLAECRLLMLRSAEELNVLLCVQHTSRTLPAESMQKVLVQQQSFCFDIQYYASKKYKNSSHDFCFSFSDYKKSTCLL